jgi:ElaB/YqjD/DUF883 family membrane-anchored ribosome-binding protein
MRWPVRSPRLRSSVTISGNGKIGLSPETAVSEVNQEKRMSDIKTVLSDAEDLLKQAASATGDRATELREKALTLLKQARENAANAQVVVVEKGKKAARATDDYVHDHPWTSIGIAAGAGALIGLLINRK